MKNTIPNFHSSLRMIYSTWVYQSKLIVKDKGMTYFSDGVGNTVQIDQKYLQKL